MRTYGVFGRFKALAGAKVEVVLVQRRGDDDVLAKVPGQATRQHAGAGAWIDVVDGVEVAITDAEHRDVAPLDQCAYAGAG